LSKQACAFWPVRQIIDLFVQMGCLHNVAEETIQDPDGDCFGLSYLLNPETNEAVPILDLADGDLISEMEVQSWERRLGITIPKPPH
jgi:hypothetical protein